MEEGIEEGEAVVQQQIAATISNSCFMKICRKTAMDGFRGLSP